MLFVSQYKVFIVSSANLVSRDTCTRELLPELAERQLKAGKLSNNGANESRREESS